MVNSIREKHLVYREFLNRENQFRHHDYDKEMYQYELLKRGDLSAIEESIKMFSSSTLGQLSDDTIRNGKYLFVASTTLATRFAIEGGMDSEKAYNASDLYIQKMDRCQTLAEIMSLHTDMFSFFTTQVAKLSTQNIFSKPVIQSMDYIYKNLNQNINVTDIANHVGLNANYLSVLFKKEVQLTISAYIRKRRVEAATNMLKYSDYSYSEISAYLAFCSQSYFIRIFKKETGYTPKEYKKRFYRNSFDLPI